MYNKFERELLNEGAKLKTWDAPNNSGCKYCDRAEALVIGETDDYGIAIKGIGKHTYIHAYGYDVHGSGSNGLSAKINFCPMCGKRFEQQ